MRERRNAGERRDLPPCNPPGARRVVRDARPFCAGSMPNTDFAKNRTLFPSGSWLAKEMKTWPKML